MTGIECTGDYCDNVSLRCTHLNAGRIQNCGWTEWLSDESRWNVFLPGKVANGVRCLRDNCDLMRYFVCDLKP
jgi:hypothetical protein